jgi:hypothetical protein
MLCTCQTPMLNATGDLCQRCGRSVISNNAQGPRYKINKYQDFVYKRADDAILTESGVDPGIGESETAEFPFPSHAEIMAHIKSKGIDLKARAQHAHIYAENARELRDMRKRPSPGVQRGRFYVVHNANNSGSVARCECGEVFDVLEGSILKCTACGKGAF